MGELGDPELEVSERSTGDTITLVVSGELDVASADVLHDRVDGLRPLGGALQLDLAALRFVDSSGVRALVAARRAAVEDTGEPVRLVGVTDTVRKVLAMMGLAEAFGLEA